MEQLRNLEELFAAITQRFSQYDGSEFVLPKSFREQVKEIDNNTVEYYAHSAVIKTRKGLNIFLPNQWFYIASYFTELYNELQNYKQKAIKVVSPERLKILNGSSLSESEKLNIKNLLIDETSKSYLEKFITDYSWWNGAKTIDRGDFYVSPILNCAKLVNVSQSYIADLCAFLADKTDLVKSIIHSTDEVVLKEKLKHESKHLQQIFYGAPGTGKSHKTNMVTRGEDVVRTTFHPDTDYATFVGCYKPMMKSSEPRLLSKEELKLALYELKKTGEAYPCQRFGSMYWNSLDILPPIDIKEILLFNNFTENFSVEVKNGVHVGKALSRNQDERIVYEFVPQAFLQAYISAWKKIFEEGNPQKQYLVIEEINRGNCAQIFGDLFQLLDRNEYGYSDYPIHADNDLKRYLEKEFAGLGNEEKCNEINALFGGCNVMKKVLKGEILILPNNLYIWATMNTSDQSLFPIDSAFKRRWDWQYMPIYNAEKNWTIAVDGQKYDWWEFIETINQQIGTTTNSEDKKLGYFFCKASSENEISAETFVGKVIFYLWNDVFKDFGFDNDIFRDENNGLLSFDRFYTVDKGETKVATTKVAQFLTNLGLSPIEETTEINNEEDTEEEDNNFAGEKKVIFPDGEEVSAPRPFDAFFKAVEKIGVDRIKPLLPSLAYARRGFLLVTDQYNPASEQDNRYSYRETGGLYFLDGSASRTYQKLLTKISNLLNLNLNVMLGPRG